MGIEPMASRVQNEDYTTKPNPLEFYFYPIIMNKKEIELSSVHRFQIQTLIERINLECGIKTKLTLTQFDREDSVEFCEFDGKLVVYDMDKNFKELEGNYENMQDLKDRIKQLQVNEYYSETKSVEWNNEPLIIGKCRKCGSYNDDRRTERRNKSMYMVGEDPTELVTVKPNDIDVRPRCCPSWSPWGSVDPSRTDGWIWERHGWRGDGTGIGRYKFIE